jgi:hypothetical protein
MQFGKGIFPTLGDVNVAQHGFVEPSITAEPWLDHLYPGYSYELRSRHSCL